MEGKQATRRYWAESRPCEHGDGWKRVHFVTDTESQPLGMTLAHYQDQWSDRRETECVAE